MATKGSIILQLFGGVIGDAEELFLTDALQKFHDKDPVHYESSLKAIHIGIVELKKITDASKSKFDDIFVNNALEAVEASAEENGVTLPE